MMPSSAEPSARYDPDRPRPRDARSTPMASSRSHRATCETKPITQAMLTSRSSRRRARGVDDQFHREHHDEPEAGLGDHPPDDCADGRHAALVRHSRMPSDLRPSSASTIRRHRRPDGDAQAVVADPHDGRVDQGVDLRRQLVHRFGGAGSGIGGVGGFGHGGKEHRRGSGGSLCRAWRPFRRERRSVRVRRARRYFVARGRRIGGWPFNPPAEASAISAGWT